MIQKILSVGFFLVVFNTLAQKTYFLKPDRIFDGYDIHEGWKVLVKGDQIVAVGTEFEMPKDAEIIEMKGFTLMPGFIEEIGRAHV